MPLASLSGITVVSMAEQYPGPLCTRLLHELGAEVILVERPGVGDPQREAGPWLFRSAAIGKKSIALNLKNPAAQDAARKLIARSQVFVEGYRPGVAQRLGLGYDPLRELNPALVYCSISGFGQDGPYRNVTGHNLNYEAISGAIDPYLRPELGLKYFDGGIPVGDIMAALTAALGIAAAVRSAEKTGEGRYIDIAITDALVLALAPNLCKTLNGDRSGWPTREAGYGLFETADGTIALGIAHEDHFWEALCDLLNLPSLASLSHQERVEKGSEVRKELRARFATRATQAWLDVLAAKGIPCSRANELGDVAADPHLRSRGLFATALDETGRTFSTAGSPFQRSGSSTAQERVPALGADTCAVLQGLGYTELQIQAMQQA